jgi:hypothetical protein
LSAKQSTWGMTGVHRDEPLAQTDSGLRGHRYLARRQSASSSALSRSTTASAAPSRGEPCGQQQVPDVTRAGHPGQFSEDNGPPSHSLTSAKLRTLTQRHGQVISAARGRKGRAALSPAARAHSSGRGRRPRRSCTGHEHLIMTLSCTWGAWGAKVLPSAQRYPHRRSAFLGHPSLQSPRWSINVGSNHAQGTRLH